MQKIILILLLLLPFSVMAQKRNYSAELDRYTEAHEHLRGFSGTVLVMKQNNILLKKAYGLADREWNIPNTVDTKYSIGSITWQFTAACILQLMEQGKLQLSDKLSAFIPGFPKGDSVTIHMLLNHTSGIDSYSEIAGFVPVTRHLGSKDSIVSYFKGRPYNFSPGSKFLYTNSGFFLLGDIIEKVSGQPYNDYLRQHILEKLDMSNTGVDRMDTILTKRARGYQKKKGVYVNTDYTSLDWPFSSGLLYSTVDDLYKWDRALNGNSVISESSRQKMFTPGKGNYGYGIIIDSLAKHYRTWHNGGIRGFASNISRYLNDDVTIVVLSNDSYNSDLIASGLAANLFDLPVEFPYLHKEINIDPALLQRYVGKYNAFLTLEVMVKDGKLFRHRDGTEDIELKPESQTKFFYGDDSDRQLEFEVDKAGKVTKIWFINNGQRGEMKRVK